MVVWIAVRYSNYILMPDHSAIRLLWTIQILDYSGGSNSEHSNTEYIQNPNILMFWFGMVRFLNGRFYSLCYRTDHSKTELFKMAALALVVLYVNKKFFMYKMV